MTDTNQKLREALQSLINIIDAAGLINLSNGVLFGPTVWYVKASDIMIAARDAIAAPDVTETNFGKMREALRQIIEQHGQWNNGIWAANIARRALALPTAAPVGERPDCFVFAMEFLGEPEASKLMAYVEQLEARAALSAGDAVDARRLDDLRRNAWSLCSFVFVPTNDAVRGIGWRVVERSDRVVSMVFDDDPRAAIDAAREKK